MLFLLDKSAHELARRDLAARRVFETLAITGVLATCAIVELEILYSARNPTDHARLKTYLHELCVWLEISDDMFVAAINLQEDLLAAGLHRKPIPDVIIDDRDKRRAARRIHDAGFPRGKRIEEFDFAANPSINPAIIHQLAARLRCLSSRPGAVHGDWPST